MIEVIIFLAVTHASFATAKDLITKWNFNPNILNPLDKDSKLLKEFGVSIFDGIFNNEEPNTLLINIALRKKAPEDFIRFLLDRGADIHRQDSIIGSPLHAASETITGANYIPLLLEHGAKIDVKNENGKTPLYWAMQNNNGTVALELVEQGAKLNDIDKGNEKMSALDFVYLRQKDILSDRPNFSPNMPTQASYDSMVRLKRVLKTVNNVEKLLEPKEAKVGFFSSREKSLADELMKEKKHYSKTEKNPGYFDYAVRRILQLALENPKLYEKKINAFVNAPAVIETQDPKTLLLITKLVNQQKEQQGLRTDRGMQNH